MSDIPEDATKRARLVQTWQLRMMRSAAWSDEQRATFVRCYKRYRQIVDAVLDTDEPNITLGYVVGLVNQFTSKAAEPILDLRPPCPVYPIRNGHQRSAKNFENMARAWYASPQNQDPLFCSKKEMVICGTRFEIDEWANTQRMGKTWGKQPKQIEVDDEDADGNKLGTKTSVTKMVDAEIPKLRLVKYGFSTRYPSIFNCYPEPYRRTIGTGEKTDCTWFVEDLEEFSLEELCREFYVDENGKKQPMYDFTELLHDAGPNAEARYKTIMGGGDGVIEDAFGPLITPSKPWTYQSDYNQQDTDTIHPAEGSVDRQASEDRDKIWLCRGYADNEIITIAQGKYVIHRKLDPWHVPGIKIRAESLIADPKFIYGMGLIEPIEDELDMKNDIRNLSMSQFIRAVSKLMAVHIDSIVSMNDFKLGAGGKVRIHGDRTMSEAIKEIPMESSTNEMLALESQLSGDIEFVTSNLDGSPGVRGTKQQHKTARGMELIQANLTPVFKTIFRQGLVNEAWRMDSMQKLVDQFGFQKMPFDIMRDDGSFTFAELNKDDIGTDGHGFRYAVEVDPSFGNTQAQRQDAAEAFQDGLAYEKIRLETKDPKMKKLDLSELFEKRLRLLGWRDTSGIFKLEGKIMDPMHELDIIMQGGSAECAGDLVEHMKMHLLQRESPMVKKAIEAGKATPDTMQRLELLISQCAAKIKTFMADPMGAAQAERGKSIMMQGQQ